MSKRKKPVQVSSAATFAESLERMRPLLSTQQFSQLLDELSKPLATSIRINPLKSSLVDLHRWANRYGWQIEVVPFCPMGFRILSAETPVSQTVEHKLGYYYIQDASSMLPVELFDFPQQDLLILDMAASPGGKTTHLLGRTLDHGLTIANDSSPDRIQALRIVLQNWGAANVAVTRFPGEKIGLWFPEYFDRVLLDAPCSMEGLRTTEAHPLRPVSEKERSTLTRRQASLLESALVSCKVGGQVVYSTCTLAPEEDEVVLDQLLQKHSTAFRIDDISHRLAKDVHALSEFQGTSFSKSVVHAARLWPFLFHTAGFFAARLTKLKTMESPILPLPEHNLSPQHLIALPRDALETLGENVMNTYGFAVIDWLDDQHLTIYQHNQYLFAIPEVFFQDFPSLPFQSLGMMIAEQVDRGYVISHEFAARFGDRFTNGYLVIDESQTQAWLRGENLITASSAVVERIVLLRTTQGQNLGRGKWSCGRIKNLLPHRVL
jgi:16S rRNA (cytosine1407-C5)-methyltransferase